MQSVNALIIGGGIAGVATAQELAGLGFSSMIVEKEPFLGGHAAQLTCKATDVCQKCGVCLVEDQLESVLRNQIVHLSLSSELVSLEKVGKQFQIKIRKDPSFINGESCSNCGSCLALCPEAAQGAITQSYSVHNRPAFHINPLACVRFAAEADCKECFTNCPTGAIDFGAVGGELDVLCDVLVIATGFNLISADHLKRFGYGLFPDVITALELERLLRLKGKVLRPSDSREPEKIAFIQCVGSRERDNPFCSQVCCAYALRMGRAIRTRQPAISTTVFYIDIQTFGKNFLASYGYAKSNMRLIRMLPADVIQNKEGRLSLNYLDDQTHDLREEDFDMLVLSIGFRPSESGGKLAKLLGVNLSEYGFFSHENGDKRILATGTATGPMSIADTIADAGKTAWEVAKYLGKHFRP